MASGRGRLAREGVEWPWGGVGWPQEGVRWHWEDVKWPCEVVAWPCKPVHLSQFQNCAIFTSYFWSIL